MTAVVIGVAVGAMLLAMYLAWGSTAGSTALSPQLLFVTASVLFINGGFLVRYLENLPEPWAAAAVISVSLGCLAAACGGALGSSALGMSQRWRRRTFAPVAADLSYPLAMAASLVIFAVVLLYFLLLGYVPLLVALRQFLSEGFSSNLLNTPRVSRDPYINPEASYIPLQGFMEAVRYFGLPIVAVWFVDFRRRGVRRHLSLAMVIAAGVLIVFTGQRWPLMYLLLAIMVYLSWTLPHPGRYKKLLRRILFTAVVLGIVLSILLGRTAEDNLTYPEMLTFGVQDLFERIFMGNVDIPFLSYGFFPDQEEWLLGGSYAQNFMALAPGQGESYPVTLNKLIMGDNSGFTAPPDLFTEAYINFGWAGVIAIPFLWGLGLAYVQHVILRAQRLTTLAYGSLLVTILTFSPAGGVMFVVGGLIVIVFVMTTIQGLFFLGFGGHAQPLAGRFAGRSARDADRNKDLPAGRLPESTTRRKGLAAHLIARRT